MRQIADILSAIMPEVRELDDDETLTYLHGCISTKRHFVRAPDTPAYLDAFLCDDDFQGGLFPRLGGQYMRTLSVRAYPTASSPGLLDRLNELGISYRWTCRFLPLDKEDARKALTTVRKRWFAKRKGVMALIKEAVTREPSLLEDPDAAAKASDADAALAILGGDYASIGYFTPTVTLMDPDPDRLADRVREVESAINRMGFVCKVEDVNAVEAWLGSLPGQAYADLRRPLVSSLNLCDMIPMSAIWPGPSRNAHLTSESLKRGHEGVQPPLMVTRTAGTTPFRFDLHQADVGHTMIVGPTGAGQVGAPEHHRHAVAAVSRIAGLLFRQRRLLAGLHAPDRRSVLHPRRRSVGPRLPAAGRPGAGRGPHLGPGLGPGSGRRRGGGDHSRP